MPKERLNRVTEITPDWLAQRGLRGVVVDLDNTLVPYGVTPPPPQELAEWKQTLDAAGIPLAIVSNAKKHRTRLWAEALGVSGWGLAGKPLPLSLRKTFAKMGLQPSEVAVVGDQLFTDVLGANLAGGYAVLVDPIEPKKGLPHTRWVRKLEKSLLERHFPSKRGVTASPQPIG